MLKKLKNFFIRLGKAYIGMNPEGAGLKKVTYTVG
jgi:hypothetical protein